MNGTALVATGGQALLSAPESTVSPEAPVVVSRYLARPGRRALVIADLADLRGPAGGTVELPVRLFWQPKRTFDLDDPAIRRWVYQIVLREASRPEDLTQYLNGEVLRALWPDLRLPRGVRRAWEELHPSLALPAAAGPVAAGTVAAGTVAAGPGTASTVAA